MIVLPVLSRFTNLCKTPQSAYLRGRWDFVKNAIQAAGANACGLLGRTHSDHWLSTQSLELMEQRRQVPSGRNSNGQGRQIRYRLTKQLKADRENWWISIACQMEVVAAACNTHRLFKLIKDTSGRKNFVSETIYDKHGAPIHNRACRLERWMEYFREQFNWPPAERMTAIGTVEPQ